MKSLFMALFLFGSMNAYAAAPASAQKVSTNASEIVQQQTAIRAEVLSGKGAFKDMDASARDKLLRHQEIVIDLLKDKELTTDLSEADQVRVSNSISSIVAAVKNAEDDRMVCRREKTTGSHRPETICKTVAQRRLEREQSRDSRNFGGNAKCTTDCSGESMRPQGW